MMSLNHFPIAYHQLFALVLYYLEHKASFLPKGNAFKSEYLKLHTVHICEFKTFREILNHQNNPKRIHFSNAFKIVFKLCSITVPESI